MRYMVIERFKEGAIREIYTRLEEEGRMMPEGLEYVNSWISSDLGLCFQLMECENEALFEEWKANWKDLFELEIFPVLSSAEASAKALGEDAERE